MAVPLDVSDLQSATSYTTATQSQPTLPDDPILPVGDAAEGSHSRDSGKFKRLSQSVPKRSKSHQLVNEEEPWDAKNILSFGKIILWSNM
jgi:hypothetical protein